MTAARRTTFRRALVRSRTIALQRAIEALPRYAPGDTGPLLEFFVGDQLRATGHLVTARLLSAKVLAAIAAGEVWVRHHGCPTSPPPSFTAKDFGHIRTTPAGMPFYVHPARSACQPHRASERSESGWGASDGTWKAFVDAVLVDMEMPLNELRKVAGAQLRGHPDTATNDATVCLYGDLADPATRPAPRGGRPGKRSVKQTTRRSVLRLGRLFRILAEDAAYVNDGVATFRVLVREGGRRFYLRSPQKGPGDGLQDTDVVFLVSLGLVRWTRKEEFASRWALNQTPHIKTAVLEAMDRPTTDGTLSDAILDAVLTLPTELTDGIDAFQSWRNRQKLP